MTAAGVDFFVSYTSADQPWAEWIAWELEDAGYGVIIQAWDMQPGSNFLLEMHQATLLAARTIAVLSPAFLQSEHCAAEWGAAFRKDPTGRERRLVPVRVHACEPDGLVGPVVYVDLVGLTPEDAREALLAGVRGVRAKPAQAPPHPDAQEILQRRKRERPPLVGSADRASARSAFDVLIVTATQIETAAVQDVFSAGSTVHGQHNTYRDLGLLGNARVALVQCSEMGAGGTGGAALVVRDAILDVKPSCVLLVGIAFGLDPGTQHIGDVLCATRIVDYETQRVGTSAEGEMSVRSRGVSQPTSPRLLGRLQNAASEFPGRVEFGVMLSGDKLIDNIDFRNRLMAITPDARGGEMEALGVSAAAGRENLDWCVIKSYCDWADGHKQHRKKERQKAAALRAAEFVHVAIAMGGFAIDRAR